MKNKKLILTILSLSSAFLAGCSEKTQEKAKDAYEDTAAAVSNSAENAGDAISSAWDQVAGYTVEKKDDFVDAMQSSYAELESKAEAIESESDNLSAEAIDAFNEAGKTFEEQLDKAAAAGSDTWDSTKDGVKNAWEKVVESYNALKSEVDA